MKIVFVCTGNTCRSPMAEGYLKSLNIKGLEVLSRGLFADGSRVSANSSEAMLEIGIDISGHISKQISTDDLSADKIICLSESHRDILIGCGLNQDKITVLGNGISDPFGGDIHVYRLCRDQIIKEIDSLVFSGAFTPFTVENADYDDFKKIAQLEAECFSENWSENALLESFSAGTHFYIAKEQDEVIGYVGISTILDEGYITNIAVTSSHRQKGVATLLLKRIFSLAREKALAFVSLEVRVSNSSAISLYEKLGFKKVGERRDFYRDPKENASIMTKRFDEIK